MNMNYLKLSIINLLNFNKSKEPVIKWTHYERELKILRKYGFNPIGVCWYKCEITFIFTTIDEKDKAYQTLGSQQKRYEKDFHDFVDAWWYEKEEFFQYLKEDSETLDGFWTPERIEWLNTWKFYFKNIFFNIFKKKLW